MAPSLHSEAPHAGLRDQLLGPRGTLPVPSLLPDAPLRAGSCPAERCSRIAVGIASCKPFELSGPPFWLTSYLGVCLRLLLCKMGMITMTE